MIDSNKVKFAGVLFLLVMFFNCEKMNNPIIIGHRGAMGHETENTLASIQKAIDLGVDMIEIDVFNIKSGETVVFHDETLERLTNAGGNIEDWGYFELRKVKLEGGHNIPMLQDVLKLIDHKVKLNIELKGAGTTDRVNYIVNYYIKEKGWKLDDFIISSFKWNELRAMRALSPEIPIAILTSEDINGAITIGNELQAEAINPNYQALTAENSLKIKEAGFKIYTWTVNEPEDITKMKEFGVDGIITNFPERVH